MSKYKVGDKFIVEVKKEINNDDNDYTLYKINFDNLVFDEDELGELQQINPKLKIEDIDDMLAEHDLKKEAYEKGLNDAWELAHKCVAFTDECKFKIFDTNNPYCIIANNTYQEALAKLEAYEQSKAIKVNDVVDHQGLKGVVTRVTEDFIHVLTCYGTTPHYTASSGLKKTGLTIDISSILEQLRRNE